MSATRVLVFGSCVARDTLEATAPESRTLVSYVARQSVISAFSPAVTLLPVPRATSPFQQRMLEWDYSSHLRAVIRRSAGKVDLVLWDLTDERLGVYVLPDDTVITRSVDLMTAGAEASVASHGHLVEFGTDAHHHMWRLAASRFVRTVQRHHPDVPLVLLAAPWAEHNADGSRTRASFELGTPEANRLYGRYYDTAAALAGVDVVGRDLLVTAWTSHPWGEAPFHYHPDVYRRLIADICDVTARRGSSPGERTTP